MVIKAGFFSTLVGLMIRFAYDQKIIKLNSKYWKTVTIFLVVFLVVVYKCQDPIISRVNSNNRLEAISNNERIEYISESWKIIKQNPIFGVGAGNYVLELEQQNPGLSVWDYQAVHNVFLLIWAEIGIFGLLSFLAIIVYLLFWSIKQKNVFKICVMLSLVLFLFLDHWLWSWHMGWLFLGLVGYFVYED